VLIILAGITLNAVIGEDGIIFQAKDTKNMITNETAYDDKQLAELQNELKDNSIYSGIGLIPGTDTGGSSEGGESGSGSTGGGSGNTGNTGSGDSGSGGSGTGGTTGGGTVSGESAQQPTISVLEGEEIAASFYRSDVTIQISTVDKTQKIKYILTTTVDEINNELYPSGLVKEIDIANGGTLTFTKDGEYTITAYAYDVYGQKSEATIMWLKRETGTTPGNGVTVSIASGNEGLNNWYTSNVTLRVLGTDTGTARVTYRVKGTAYSNGIIGNTEHSEEYYVGEVDTGEIQISNGTTFQIALDGDFSIVAYTYNDGGVRLSTATTVDIRRDASRPIVTLYKGERVIGSGFQITMSAEDYASNLATQGRYTYRHKYAPTLDYTDNVSQNTTHLYTGLEENKTYDMYVIVKDEAGNMTASDVISRPAIWISNTPTVGDTVSGGIEGARKYCSTDVNVSITGQDENNVDISRVTYQILGTTTSAGQMDSVNYDKGVALTDDELEMGNNHMIPIRADGNWTIKVHTYNKENVRVTTSTLEVTRDTVTPNPPTIAVASGTMGDETYYRSDISVRLTSQDDTCYKKTTYTVTGTATGAGTIGGVSITSGQTVNIGETEIANNGTFDIKADGRWTIKGYTYDKAGRKSALATGITVTRDTVNPVANTPTISGTQGETSYYRGTPTVTLNGGSDVTSPIKKHTYVITGTTKTAGTIAGTSYAANTAVNTGEIDVASGGTITVGADGTFTVTSYTYDVSGRKSAASTALTFTRDATAPTISAFTVTSTAETTASAVVNASDATSGLATSGTYKYYFGSTVQATSTTASHSYTGLANTTDYATGLSVVITDKAGNTKTYNPTNPVYHLVDRVTVGDYVAYDAGTWPSGAQSGTGWTSNTTTATTNGHFSGYTAGANKGTSVTGTTSGWRVLSKTGSGSSGTVTLVSAGSPANAYYAGNNSSYSTGMVTALNNFASANYVNTSYASSAGNMTTTTLSTASSAGLADIDVNYYLGTAGASTMTQYKGSGTSYTGYLFRMKVSNRDWYRYSGKKTVYTSTTVSTLSRYSIEYVNGNGTRGTFTVSGGSVSTYTASGSSGTYYYYIYDSSAITGGSSSSDVDYYKPTGTRKAANTNTKWYVLNSSTGYGTYSASTYGTRPVVTLKAGVKTNNAKDTAFLSQTCWAVK